MGATGPRKGCNPPFSTTSLNRFLPDSADRGRNEERVPMSTSRPRKQLPVNPSLEHLQKQAKRRSKQSPALSLAAVQHQIAQEYGCKNWAELAHMVTTMARRQNPALPPGERYTPMPKAARARDFAQIRRLLEEGAYTPNDLDQSLAHLLWYGDPSTWPERKTAADLLLEYGADPDAQYGSGGYGPIVFGTGECIQPEGLLYLIEAGADVSFPPIQTKYGQQCPLSSILGTYGRGDNTRKHRYLEILLAHRPFIPPEVTPPVLAIHCGDAQRLGELLDRDPGLLNRTFPDLPYGNIYLLGGTLLHCAVEFGEDACVTELLRRGANVNARAEIIDGIGGQTPLFHALAWSRDQSLPTLEHLVRHAGPNIDPSVRATFRRHGEVQTQPITALELAEQTAPEITSRPGTRTAESLALLRSLPTPAPGN